MKRFIAAAALAVLSTSAFAVEVGKPFEQIDLDRTLPEINVPSERTQLAAAAWSNDHNVASPSL